MRLGDRGFIREGEFLIHGEYMLSRGALSPLRSRSNRRGDAMREMSKRFREVSRASLGCSMPESGGAHGCASVIFDGLGKRARFFLFQAWMIRMED